MFAYWIPYDVTEERGVTGTCSVKFDQKANIKNPVILDMLSGEVSIPDEGDWNMETATVKNLPIGEYPFVICDRSAIEVI